MSGDLVAVGSIPLCAAVAAGAVQVADGLLGETVPSSCGKRGLVVGLMGIWGTVLFGFLLAQTERIADRIAGTDQADLVASCGTESTASSH